MVEVVFTGRKVGAIGVRYSIKEWVKNDPRTDEMACRIELAEKYEHISHIIVCESKHKNFMV